MFNLLCFLTQKTTWFFLAQNICYPPGCPNCLHITKIFPFNYLCRHNLCIAVVMIFVLIVLSSDFVETLSDKTGSKNLLLPIVSTKPYLIFLDETHHDRYKRTAVARNILTILKNWGDSHDGTLELCQWKIS